MKPPFLSHDNLQNPFLLILERNQFAEPNAGEGLFVPNEIFQRDQLGRIFGGAGERKVWETSGGSYFCLP